MIYKQSALPCIIAFSFFISSLQGQLFDLSDGNSTGLKFPCGESNFPGPWKFEEAGKYSGGPTAGTVLTSDNKKMSCILVESVVVVNHESKFNFMVYLPYTKKNEALQVWLLDEDLSAKFEWFKLPGPIVKGENWVERSMVLPPSITSGRYFLEIWDTSSKHSISFRYFDISTEENINSTSPESTTELVETTISTIITSEITTTTTEIITTEPDSTNTTDELLETTYSLSVTSEIPELTTEILETSSNTLSTFTTEDITISTTETVTSFPNDNTYVSSLLVHVFCHVCNSLLNTIKSTYTSFKNYNVK